jgi:hypothetical protein
MLHEVMCSCLYGIVFTLLVLVVCCTALEFCFVFVDLDGLGDVYENSIGIYGITSIIRANDQLPLAG